MDTNQILDRWAQHDAAKSIMADLGIRSIKAIYRVVEEARAMHDPRAEFRRGRESKGRTVPNKRRDERAKRRRFDKPEVMDGWHFGKCSIYVTVLGTGSLDCQRIPISVSCVAVGMPLQRARDGAGGSLPVSRSLAEAMAKHPLAAASGHSGEPMRP